MNFYVILLFFNLQGDVINWEKIPDTFTSKEICETVGNIIAGQKTTGPRDLVVPVCVKLR